VAVLAIRGTDLRSCCAANVAAADEAREVEGYRDFSNRFLGCGDGDLDFDPARASVMQAY